MSGKVIPGGQELDEEGATAAAASSPPAGSGLAAKIRQHPWVTAVIVLLVCGAIATAVAVPCALLGCPAKSSDAGEQPGLPRLLVNYKDATDALTLIPDILRRYITNTILNESSIQILDFISNGSIADTELLIKEARGYLEDHPGLNFLLRDFAMQLNQPDFAAADLQGIVDSVEAAGVAAAVAAAAAGGGAGRKLHAAAALNDPLYANGTQYYVDSVNASGAWGYTNSSNVVVAIIDTGLDLSHPDLQANLWVNPGEIPGDGIDNDGNGYIDDVNGYDFSGACSDGNSSCPISVSCTNRSAPWASDTGIDPLYYHGSHVASVVGAVQNNGLGITGIANGVKIMVLRVSDCHGKIDDPRFGYVQASSVYKAYEYAAKNGAHVVSFSIAPTLGPGGAGLTDVVISAKIKPSWPSNNTYKFQNDSYVQAMKPLVDRNVLLVAAAGNDNLDVNALNNLGYFIGVCGTNLPNVLCVGGTDAPPRQASKSSFSSYGSPTVHIGAPSVGITGCSFRNNSGVLSHLWNTTSGTSESAPMVAGAAALVLSRLGSADGNFYKATQAKSVLLASATLPTGSSLPWQSGSTLNVGRAVWWAGVVLQRSNILVSVAPKYASLPAAAMTFRALSESYYATAGNQLYGEISGPVVDSSVRRLGLPSNPPNISGFKYSSNYIVSYRGLMEVTAAGQWGVQVRNTNQAVSSSMWVLINGQQVPINSTTQTGIFLANATGWFDFEMRFAFPQGRYDLLFKGPQDTAFTSLYNFMQLLPQAPAMPDYAPAAQLSWYWQAFYNKVTYTLTAANQTPFNQASLTAITPAAKYQYTTVFRDLNNMPKDVKYTDVLFPGEVTNSSTAASGYQVTYIRSLTAFSLSFNVSCAGCQLLVDGALVVDVYDALLLKGLGLSKVSPCMTFAGNTTHQLILRFATANLFSIFTIPNITYTACAPDTFTFTTNVTGNLANDTQMVGNRLATVGPVIFNPMVWQPMEAADSIGTAGVFTGVQCDVYSSGGRTLSISAQSSSPAYKVRLPLCAVNAVDCSAPWNFTLETLLPGLAAGTPPGVTYAVRCWTYYNKGFTALTVSPAANSAAYVGGRQAFGAGSTAAPTTTLIAGNPLLSGDIFQLVSVDWLDVSAAAWLAVLDRGVPLTIALSSMKLPITDIAYSANGSPGSADIFTGKVVLSVPGAFARSAWPPAGDVPRLVRYNLAAAYKQMNTSACMLDTTVGLAGTYTFPTLGRVTAAATRYTQVQGYYWPAVLGNITFTVVDAAAAATAVVMGDVTVLNARPFSTASAAATSTFLIYFPTRIGTLALPIDVITKASRPDASSRFDFSACGIQPTCDGPIEPSGMYILQAAGQC